MPLPRSRKDREQQKFVDDGSGNVAVRAVVVGGGGGGGSPGGANDSVQYRINGTTFGGMSGVNSDGDTIILDRGVFLKTIDKDDNVIDVAGYFGEVLLFGDFGGSGNPVVVLSGEVVGSTSDSGIFSLGKDGWSKTIRKEDVTDPENPVTIESYEEQASYAGTESRYEGNGESFFGFQHLYGNYSQVVSDNQTILDFKFEGNNDGLSRVAYAGRKIEATLRELGNERGTIIDQAVINGTMTDAMRIGDGGLITFNLLTQFQFDGTGYAKFETGNNTGVYAYQFGASTTVPADASAGWNGNAIFEDSDATVGTYNKAWINTGTSASSLFKRIAIVENTNQLAMADGTAAAPFYSFPTSLSSGLYLASANSPAIATNGTVKLQINSNTNIQSNLPFTFGASTAPGASVRGFGRGTSTLVYNVPTGDVHDFTVNGTTVFRLNSVGEKVKVTDTITASATQTQGQQPLVSAYNIVTVVANTNDTVTLPTAVQGQIVRIKNEGANTLQVFPATGDSVNNGTVNASVTQATNTFYMYIADDATNWTRVQFTIA